MYSKECVRLHPVLYNYYLHNSVELVEVHSQTEFPYVSFMGETLPNHSYVDLTLVGYDRGNPGDTVRCITDLSTCCSSGQGPHDGRTGISLTEIDCHSLAVMLVFMRLVELRELSYVVGTMLTHNLVYYIAVILQL